MISIIQLVHDLLRRVEEWSFMFNHVISHVTLPFHLKKAQRSHMASINA